MSVDVSKLFVAPAVNPLDANTLVYETVRLTGALLGNIIITIPFTDGWSTRLLDQATNPFTVTIQAPGQQEVRQNQAGTRRER